MPGFEFHAPAREALAVGNWVAKHPYLEPAAKLNVTVDTVVADVAIPTASIPKWNDYANDHQAGIPLLHSREVSIEFHELGNVLISVVKKLASTSLPGTLAEDCQALHDELRSDSFWSYSLIGRLLGEIRFSLANAGLLRYIGWTLLAPSLGPLVTAFNAWRDEEQWLRSYCPTCGSPPAMAQLVGTDPARLKYLFCSCCHTRWRHPRTACPFCEISDNHRLLSLAVEGEHELRIDYCDACNRYLKTYVGEGNEALLLADWTSIHFDTIARDRGLKRSPGSIYEF